MATVRDQQKEMVRRRLSGRHCEAGDMHALQDKADDAIASYRRATELDGRSARAYVGMGDAYALVDRDDRARGAYEKALSADPNNAEAHFCMADLLARSGQVQEAICEMEIAVECDPDRAYYLYRLSELYTRVGDDMLAEEGLMCAIDIDPGEGLYRYKLGELHARDREWDLAARAYIAATQCAPLDDFYHIRLVTALLRLNRRPSALAVLRRTCRISPDNRAYRYLLGELLVLTGDLEAGSAELRRAGRLDSYDKDYVRRIKIRSGQLEEGEKLVLIGPVETPTLK